MLQLIENDLYEYLALTVLLLAILFGYRKGRNVVSANGRSPAWTQVPLITLAIASLGPSAFAIMIYLGYKFGLVQPKPPGYRFSTFIRDLPMEFAVINWPFVALYVTCRTWPHIGSARSAMWCSVVAMSLPNVLLFSTAWAMVSSAFDAGQGIGIIEAMLIFPTIAMIWPGPLPDIFDDGLGSVIAALTAPIPVLGLTGWLAGRFVGWPPSKDLRKAPERS
jgi:hypothetical protein